jgi:Domain of unknown function (DUF4878)
VLKKIAAALMLGAVLVAAGCGGGSSTSSPEDAVSSAMDALAGGPGQAGKACDYYTDNYAESVTEEGENSFDSCEEAMTSGALLAKGFGVDFDDIEIKDVKENGDTATVVTDSPMGKSTMKLVKKGDEWLIDGEEG